MYKKNGPLAQWLEQGTHNPLVLGSSPRWPKYFATKWEILYISLPIGQTAWRDVWPNKDLRDLRLWYYVNPFFISIYKHLQILWGGCPKSNECSAHWALRNDCSLNVVVSINLTTVMQTYWTASCRPTHVATPASGFKSRFLTGSIFIMQMGL